MADRRPRSLLEPVGRPWDDATRPQPRESAIRTARSLFHAVAAAVGALALTATVLAPPAGAVPGSIELATSEQTVDAAAAVTLTGRLSSGAGCVAGRDLAVGWRAADSGAYATVGHGTTAADGTFSVVQSQIHTGHYRVTAPATGDCDAAVSDAVLVRVRVLLDGTLLAGSLAVGSCVDVTVSVSPEKPGQIVELQRRTSRGWRTVDTLTLDAVSHATAAPCFGWDDVGVVRLRLRWPEQDALNATTTGQVLGLRIELAPWMQRIEHLIGGRSISVSVGEAGAFLYGHAATTKRTPASNEKLLLSMALLDTFGPGDAVRTRAATAAEVRGGVLRGDLWIIGRGDPELGAGDLARLAGRVADLGVERIAGRVRGATTYFLHDWDAHGWHDNARDYVAMPTALAVDGNVDRRGRNVLDPERRAAEIVRRKLEALGVSVGVRPGAGRPPAGLTELAAVRSRALQPILARLLRPSDNFYAEMLGKRLGAARSGQPGTIAKGAAAVEGWVRSHGVAFDLYDNSGLSYADRVSAQGIVRLLWVAESASWGVALFRALPTGGQGTLRHRFASVRVRAKTGTLTDISALSGWVWLERLATWGEFSILSHGMSKPRASAIEDKIVRILQNQAR